jgi:hypothetical protein
MKMRAVQLSMLVLLLGLGCQGGQGAQGSGATLGSADRPDKPKPRAEPGDEDDGDGPVDEGDEGDEGTGGPPDVTEAGPDGGVVLDCSPGSLTTIHVEFTCDSITVYTCKDLSNVVIEVADGERQRVEGLNGQVNSFSVPVGQTITGVWVKSGNNKSGDGPGYGERFDAPEQDCDPPQAGSGGGGTGGTTGEGGAGGTGEGGAAGSDSCGSNDPDEPCAGVGGGGSGGNGGTPLNCDETPDAPGCGVD